MAKGTACRRNPRNASIGTRLLPKRVSTNVFGFLITGFTNVTLPLPPKRDPLGSEPDPGLLCDPPGPAGQAGPALTCGTHRDAHCCLLKGHKPIDRPPGVWALPPSSLKEVSRLYSDTPTYPTPVRGKFLGSKHLQI